MKRPFGLLLLFAVAAMPNASAGVMTFTLDDHRGGNQSGNHRYGLRLDGSNLFLSLGGGGAEMYATWDDSNETLRIHGTAMESLGRNSSGDYVFGDTYSIDYTIGDQGRLPTSGSSEGANWVAAGTAGASWKGVLGDGFNELLVTNLDNPNAASISLEAKRDSTGFAMDFYEDGYRLSNDDTTWVGRGWLMDGGTNDFLFTATNTTIEQGPGTVPEPGSLAIFGIGTLTMFGFNRRRRNKKQS